MYSEYNQGPSIVNYNNFCPHGHSIQKLNLDTHSDVCNENVRPKQFLLFRRILICVPQTLTREFFSHVLVKLNSGENPFKKAANLRTEVSKAKDSESDYSLNDGTKPDMFGQRFLKRAVFGKRATTNIHEQENMTP